MAGIWIVAETREQAFELLGAGCTLAPGMEAALTAVVPKGSAPPGEYIARGADEVLLLAALAPGEPFGAHLPVIEQEAGAGSPDLILFAATARGKESAARLAARLGCGLCSGCTALAFDREARSLRMERLAYGGAAIQKLDALSKPVIVTVPPRSFEAAAAAEGRQGRVRELPAPPPSPVKIVERKPKEKAARDIAEARVIVCAGRGFDRKEDLALARELADALGGELGATRPVTEELHWLPEDLCIGLSGVQVKPELYVGLGVSGQVQHMTGVRGAKVVCAVNRDENAPIFALADFGIVGNLYEVVPKIIEALKT
ncbi:MAG: electron transfer flavoprotein subunit alpha/FixB family protein [Syntrophobacterales bacterium]|nr:electron transfer flavoprotein subunit alpha/FixB family protein [Syntrophobacterales bacterium]